MQHRTDLPAIRKLAFRIGAIAMVAATPPMSAQEDALNLSRFDFERIQPTEAEVREAVEVLERYLTVKRTEHALRAAELAAMAPESERPAPLHTQTISAEAAPALGNASLSISDQLHLADSSAVFKSDQLFLWDDADGNLGLGRQALSATTGTATDNTAVGQRALLNNVPGASSLRGSSNTAMGRDALYSNTHGLRNSAFGARAMEDNQGGFENAALGHAALADNIAGERNTAVGNGALDSNTFGHHNTALGWASLSAHAIASYNTAVGSEALKNSIGDGNLALGRRAGLNNFNGDNSIFIANEGANSDDATIKIGTQGTQTTTFVAGIHGASLAGMNEHLVCIDDQGQLGDCSESSRHVKQAIRPLQGSLEALLALRPVTFHYRHGSRRSEVPRIGLIAEEVAEIFPQLVTRDADGRPRGVRYDLLSVVAIDGLQRQQRELSDLRLRLAAVEKHGPTGDAQEPLPEPTGDRPAHLEDGGATWNRLIPEVQSPRETKHDSSPTHTVR